MKPFMMKFKQGKAPHDRDVYVNMNQVCYITTDGGTGSVLTFAAVIQDEPGYVCVNETPDQIGARSEWRT